ncbi:MAG: hypothetical protein K6L73_07785 [Cellvibrionaceae bacterium]
MNKMQLFVVSTCVFLSGASMANDIRGIKLGEQYTILDKKFQEGSIQTHNDPVDKKYGFKMHSMTSEKVSMGARSLPSGELYQIRLTQLAPFKQADEFKSALCAKYAITPCKWDRSMDKSNPGVTLYNFKGERRVGHKTISVSIGNTMKDSQKGYIWAGVSISAGQPGDVVKMWGKKVKEIELARKEAEAKKASDNADRVDITF